MDSKTLSWSEARDLLRTHREQNIRDSRKVVSIWENILEKNIKHLGDESYAVLEQVYICALDCNRMNVADSCLYALKSKFKNSVRVLLLEELKLEALEKYDEAISILNEVIEKDPMNHTPRRRKACILRSKGKITEAAKELTEHLKVFMLDIDAWYELCELYLLEQEYAKAAFCVEELILNNPYNHLYHQRFAEIKYTQGGVENYKLAMTHYLQSVKLAPNNARSLYGLFLSSKRVMNASDSQTEKKKAKNIVMWCKERCEEMCKNTLKADTIEARMNILSLN